MRRLAKGAKWVFGWALVSPHRGIRIPPEARDEYRLRAGEEVAFLAGSRTSGGLGIARRETPARRRQPLKGRVIALGRIEGSGRVVLPRATGVSPGDRLLVVRGSGLALGFVQRGPICEKARNHPVIEVLVAERAPG